MSTHERRDFKDSVYVKTIGISFEDFCYIDKIKGKKSKAGMLAEIINDYKNYVSLSTRPK